MPSRILWRNLVNLQEQGKPIELEAVNGFISRMGKALGVPTPVNDVIYGCLKPYVNGAVPQA